MRFLIDANLSPVVATRLREYGHDTMHVVDVGLFTADDEVILAAAAEDDRVIVSADADFAALLALGLAFRNATNDPLIVGEPLLLPERHAKVRGECC